MLRCLRINRGINQERLAEGNPRYFVLKVKIKYLVSIENFYKLFFVAARGKGRGNPAAGPKGPHGGGNKGPWQGGPPGGGGGGGGRGRGAGI